MKFLKTVASIGVIACVVPFAGADAYKMPDNNKSYAVSTDMPLDDVSYEYLQKLDGLGYIKSMLYGAKPYSRMDMARWTLEALVTAQERSDSGFVQTMLNHLTNEFEVELNLLNDMPADNGLRLNKVTFAADLADIGNEAGYKYYNLRNARWHSFSRDNGKVMRDGLNTSVRAYLHGNLGHDLAVSLSPQVTYNNTDHLSGIPDEYYLRSRVGVVNITAGKQAIAWGEGEDGNFLFGNKARPRTMIKFETELLPQSNGTFSFLGKTKVTGFVSQLDADRMANSVSDFKQPTLLGGRVDFIHKNFTCGMARGSMLSGKGNAFHASDFGDWLVGKNAYTEDKWDDIAGVDFRWRLPDVQVYGELYGEDQANYMPSDVAYRAGVYLPKLFNDERLDLVLEGAKTNRSWYSHGKYQAGWTYHDVIMGDLMGSKARKAYAKIGYYLSPSERVSLSYRYLKGHEVSSIIPESNRYELAYSKSLSAKDRFLVSLGFEKVNNGNYTLSKDKDSYLGFAWEHRY